MNGLIIPSRQGFAPPVPGVATDPVWGQNPTWGPAMTAAGMPAAHSNDLLLLMVERYQRADDALSGWANTAKRCFDYVEGKQWTAEQIRAAIEEDRPTLTLNKLGSLVRLVVGYHRNNRVDTRYLPTDDSASDESVADVLTKAAKQVASNCDEHYVDAEVFLDGIVGGRGFYDWRLNFDRNDLGEITASARDPFSIRPDPDSDSYDPDKWGHVFEARWVNIDEIEYTYGKPVSSLVEPLVRSSGYRGGVPSDLLDHMGEITPWRTFGGHQSDSLGFSGMAIESYIANVTDPYRKNVRLVECQHRIRTMQPHFVDLETGDKVAIPANFTPDQVMRMLQWCAEQYARKGQACPLRVQIRPTKRVRWTTIVGDIIVYDDWSPYRSFTQVPFFPYFRRGKTRGMVEDGLDPQDEINKRASSEIDIITRTAFSGWMWHKNALDESEKEKIENFGAAPGINIEWQGDATGKPEQLKPPVAPTAMERLEQKNTGNMKEIIGINDSALGQLDRAQSGRAIEARQRQSVLGIEMYMDNMRRSKRMNGRKKLEMIQAHYTEHRLIRLQDISGTWNSIGINVREASGRVINDVTIGRYDTAIDETSLSATFLNAQFEELMDLVEKGILPIPLIQDVAIDLSNAPQKTLIKARLAVYMRAQGLLTPDDLAAALKQNQLVLPNQIPAPQPHGVPGKQQPPTGTPGAPPEGGAAGGVTHGMPEGKGATNSLASPVPPGGMAP